MDMYVNNEIKEGKEFELINQDTLEQNNPLRLHDKDILIGGKEVSQELIYNILGKRFHECLKQQSQVKENYELSDKDLIH
jgi:hypothetical protein